MRLIVGIGNPGDRYKNNRHNIGFMVLDYFATINSLSFYPSRGDYYFAEGILEGQQYQLIKPSTYVNNSGVAVSQALEKTKTNLYDLFIVYDDVNLPHAELKVKAKGSNGGHNGIGSIIYHLNSDEFARLRIGVDSNFERGEMADYVLTDFTADELDILNESFKTSETLIKEFIVGGVSGLLNANSRISKISSKNNSDNNHKSI